MPSSRQPSSGPAPRYRVLIMSPDPVAAALVGALVETLGYEVRFHAAPEDLTDTLRRERPDVAMLDASDHLRITDTVLGHAAMRNIDVVVFGSQEALQGIRDIARRHDIHTLISPPTVQDTSELLTQLVSSRA